MDSGCCLDWRSVQEFANVQIRDQVSLSHKAVLCCLTVVWLVFNIN